MPMALYDSYLPINALICNTHIENNACRQYSVYRRYINIPCERKNFLVQQFVIYIWLISFVCGSL